MTDVVVHRCELRIRRTSGWAWGATPDDLIKAATRAIPQLLAAKLSELAVPEGETVVIDRPIFVKITATARQLVALGDASPGSQAVAALRATIETEVAAAVARAIVRDGVTATAPISATHVIAAEHALVGGNEAELASADAPRRAARTWWRSGTIDAVLARLEPGALARLHQLLLGDSISVGEPSPEHLAIAERCAANYLAAPEPGLDRMRRRIALAAGVVDEAPAATPAHLRVVIDRFVPIDAAEVMAGSLAASVQDVPAPVAVVEVPYELEIRSALPFLLLASLRHAGWLEAATALCELHGCRADVFALGAGIAAKVLDPVERGWLRSPADRLAIAVFAGRSVQIEDTALSAAVARMRPVFSPLDAHLRAVLGRARQQVPLALWRDDRGWYLIDTDGTVVLAFADTLRDVLAAAPATLVLVPQHCAEGSTLDQLDYANLKFVTAAPPSRGEILRSFVGVSGRLFTNDTATPAGKLAALTAHFDHALALAEELVEVLAVRPAISREPLAAFEATCTLAATVALADLGARLFPAEPATPVLALTRFRDLDARVTFAGDRLRVRVPLGRRHAELMHHAVLGDFAGVPWFAGRTIDLGGG